MYDKHEYFKVFPAFLPFRWMFTEPQSSNESIIYLQNLDLFTLYLRSTKFFVFSRDETSLFDGIEEVHKLQISFDVYGI